MNDAEIVTQNLKEREGGPALFVLGMHRSGTSALAGALRLCGAWVGTEAELTDTNAENRKGFWERRDMRQICNDLLHSTGADWWKIANFDPKAIPRLAASEQSQKFEKIVSQLDKYEAWVIKEPRLCLLLPVLRDYVKNPVCLHIYRNPLEVARSLQARNGFSISAGLALWEAYNLHALKASEGLPRISFSYESLMLHPLETLNSLVRELEGLGFGRGSIKPDSSRIERFIDLDLYHQKATHDEVEEYLLPSQRALWLCLRNGKEFDDNLDNSISEATKQALFDLESAELSSNTHQDRISELEFALRKNTKTFNAREERLKSNLEERTATLRVRDEKIRVLERSAEQLRSDLKSRDKEIDKIYNSSSWKITAPLRMLARSARWFLGKLLRGVNLLLWPGASRLSRAIEAGRNIRSRLARNLVTRPENGQLEATGRLATLIRESRKEQRSIGRRQSAAGGARTRVTVIVWDLGHNPLGRAYLLADVLRRDYDVELIGANFPRFGNEVWEPLRNCSRVTIKSFPGDNFPGHFERMEDIAGQIEGDVIYVCKPRLPGLELAVLAKLHRNRPLILDVDDYEPGFFKNLGPLTLEDVERKRNRPDFFCPHDETWTRYGESLIPMFEQVTVSNEELRKKFGGMVLPHIRDEHDFDPDIYPRDAIRAELGFTRSDKVILFAGTPRMHKGFTRVAAALESLKRSDYKLLIVGSPVDGEAIRFFNGIRSEQVKAVPNVPFSDLPGYLCAGDLICLLQDQTQMTSRYQMPGKFTDGLSMGIPILATGVPPLAHLEQKGLVELLGDTPLDRKIDEIFSNYDEYRDKAERNRKTFLREYSYGANLPRLKDMIDRVLNEPTPVPDAFRELVAYHRRVFPGQGDSPRASARVVAGGRSDPDTESFSPAAEVAGAPARKIGSYIDDKIDIVFFWKQNDTGIYGRRQDMLVKYLAEDPRVGRILHFDAPVNVFKSSGDVLKSGQAGRHSHAGLILLRTLRRIVRPEDQGKIRFDTFVFAGNGRASRLRKWILPAKRDYLDYLDMVFKGYGIGQRRTIFWVCPNESNFPMIADRFKPDLIVSDVIDDERTWPSKPRYKEALHRNYEEILARSHLTFANCLSVFEGMKEFTDNIHLVTNACELLEEDARSWQKPAELKRIKGPVIGYVGNLDIMRIDLDLLMRVASERPDWNLVLVGSMHRSKKILELNKFKNVHFLGVRVYDQALRYIRHFDVAIIPHVDNELTRSMNPLKLYVYFSLHVPVVTTPIANLEDFAEFIQIGDTPEDFIRRIGDCLDNNPLSGNEKSINSLLKKNSWNERVTRILTLIEKEFSKSDTTYARTVAVSHDKDGRLH